jgi:hypothetical protein
MQAQIVVIKSHYYGMSLIGFRHLQVADLLFWLKANAELPQKLSTALAVFVYSTRVQSEHHSVPHLELCPKIICSHGRKQPSYLYECLFQAEFSLRRVVICSSFGLRHLAYYAKVTVAPFPV